MHILTCHTKGPQGWAQFKSGPLASKTWDSTDRQWADWMLKHGSDTVTIGETIYQLTTITEE